MSAPELDFVQSASVSFQARQEESLTIHSSEMFSGPASSFIEPKTDRLS
jgi:hypothetical protein